ncbi:MAG: flagellar assembly protein T N-terminal domain-containing protein [Gammaproteobacteria bacterium]|nr:flagellar assembly protein T N-terminal domain-containing protein [Gammaproteobacteria bacterium]
MRLFYFIVLALSFSTHANAAWFESKGQAKIHNGNTEIARNNAVQDALRQALLYAGANINSVQQITNGLLTSDRFEIRTVGSVRNLQLVNERHRDGFVTVTIRADIIAEAAQCEAANFSKTLVITQFPLLDRQQAITGAIFELGQAVTTQFSNKIKYMKGQITVTQVLPLQQWQQNAISYTAINKISRSHHAQYVLMADITDISFHPVTTKWLGLISNSPQRQFNLNVALYDGINGEKIWAKQYQTTAPWHYQKQAQVNVHGQAFWQAPYGLAIVNQLSQIYNDLNDQLNCEKLSGTIVKVDGDKYIINLGSNQGLKIGQTLSVTHQGNFTDVDGNTLPMTQLSGAKLKIIQLGRYQLTAQATNPAEAGAIQIRDRVIK